MLYWILRSSFSTAVFALPPPGPARTSCSHSHAGASSPPLVTFKFCKLCFSKNWLVDHLIISNIFGNRKHQPSNSSNLWSFLSRKSATVARANFAIQKTKHHFWNCRHSVIYHYPNASCRNYDCRIAKVIKYQSLILINDFSTNPLYDNHKDMTMSIIQWLFSFFPISAVECPGCALGDLSRMPIYESMPNWVLKILWRLVVVHLLELLCLVVEDVRHDESRGLGHRGIEWQAWGAESWLDTIRSQRSQTKNNANEPKVHKCRIYTQVLQKKYDIFCGSPFYAPLQLVNFWIFFAPAITAGFKQPPLQGHHKRLSTSNAFEFWSTSLGQFGIGSAHLQLVWSKWNVILQIQHSNM